MMDIVATKKQLLEKCNAFISGRHRKITQTIADIEESLLEESKNSSGDKHETGRAMLQIDRENAGKQLLEIEKLMVIADRINVKDSSDYVRLGSIVMTDKFNYYISISLGVVQLGAIDFLCVAINSPIGILLAGKKAGDKILFNQHELTILEVQ